mmetsp:Transcript_16453/g.22838  ORF Transcript_16453/g.22838 Transcript_16453/m.22838 type:complete len:736 (+) Transcript_16453:109-2316(+)
MQQSSGVPIQRTPSNQWAPSSPSLQRKHSVCGQFKPSKFRVDVCTECFHRRLEHAQSILQDELLSKEDPYEVFELLSKIGNGTFGSVFLAKERKTQKNVAIKFLRLNQDKKTIETLVNEINILKESIECPYVVEYYGCYMKENYIMVVMEYCWCSVNDLLELCPELLFTETLISAMCACVVKGLAYIHAEGIGHRDIKPGNLLLTEEGQLKLADFGISVKMRHSRDKMMDLAGSPYWCAPEIIEGEGLEGYDKTVDIWSLGIVAIELAEGKPPLHDLSPMKVLKEIPKRPPPRLKEPHKWSKDFNEFVEMCLQKNPKDRATAKSLLKHPFVLRGSNAQILQTLVKQWMPVMESKKPKRGIKPHPVAEYSIKFEETDNTVVIVSSKTNQFDTEKIFDEYGNEIGAETTSGSLQSSSEDTNNNNNTDDGTFHGPDSPNPSPSQTRHQATPAEPIPPPTEPSTNTASTSPLSNLVVIEHYMSPRGSAEREEQPDRTVKKTPSQEAKQSPPTIMKAPHSPRHDSTRGIVLPFKGPHITHKREGKRNSRKVQKLFAVPLETTYNPKKNDHMIDQIIQHIKKKGLDINGIFRLKGKHAKMVELKVLFENREMVDLNSYAILDVISVFELFFFYLPESPLTQALYPKFLENSEIHDPSARAAAIKGTIETLPLVNKVFLKRVFSLFHDVCNHSAANGMQPARLAKYVNTLFLSKDDIVHTNKDPMQKFIITCVDHYNTIFEQ